MNEQFENIVDDNIAEGPFEPSWESLSNYQCPDWFRDAKFGIWAHWGPQSVPMFGDWYAKHMYEQDGPHGQYAHHVEKFGHPSQFGMKDIFPLWTAEKFDPEALMELFVEAGARYFVSMGVHHDNFDLWNSQHTRWNAVNMGPKRDILAAWQSAAKKHDLPFGVSEHLAASFTWWQTSHGTDNTGDFAGVPYDGNDPQYEDLYHRLAAPGDNAWYSNDPQWACDWYRRIRDLLDQYQPDLLYSDGALPFGKVGLTMLAHFYNSNIEQHNGKLEAVYNLKDWSQRPGHGDFREGIGVQDVERGGLSQINDAPWQTDTSIGDWFYNQNWQANDTGTMYRGAPWVIRNMVDMVSKNGNMLLNVIQRPDGSLDEEVQQLLSEVGVWMKINGEAIYQTRPWRIYGEGDTEVEEGAFKEDFSFSAADIRFTQAKDQSALYAIALGWPASGKLHIKALARETINSVNLLGHNGELAFEQNADGLMVTLPQTPLSTVACSLKIT